MKIDFATLAFGYKIKGKGSTPNWATALGQNKDHKINDDPEITEILKGVVYKSVSLEKISVKLGKGGKKVNGNVENSPILLAAVFSKVYINSTYITNGKFILLITRDTSESHLGRLRLKYGPSNTYKDDEESYSNEKFFKEAKEQLGLAEQACWFVTDIDILNQDELHFKAVIVDSKKTVEYADKDELHKVWSLKNNNLFRMKDGRNILLYGVPGSGKSYKIKTEYCDNERYMERVVFHPDYTYSDFVGQILPRLNLDNKLEYVFLPGPFTRILKKAYNDSQNMYYLIIEEINRGNAPAIFGEVFQLLDRDSDGFSEYGISNYEMANEVFRNPSQLVKIPSNLTIIATMNTSDQNVFTLDTAFQRRWKMKHISNKFEISEGSHAKDLIQGTKIVRGAFATVINDLIVDISLDISGVGDKRLGVYFAKINELESDVFPEKVLKYLWDDAFRMEKENIFDEKYKSLEDIIETYESSSEDKLKSVLKTSVYKKMMDKTKEFLTESNDAEENKR